MMYSVSAINLFIESFLIHQQELFQWFFSSLPRGKWLDRPDREKPKFGFGRSLWPNLRSSSALVANATGHITHKVPIKDKITFRVVVLAKTLPKSNWLHKVHVNVKQINTVSYYKNNFVRFPSWFIFWQWRVLLCTFPRKIMRKLRFIHVVHCIIWYISQFKGQIRKTYW